MVRRPAPLLVNLRIVDIFNGILQTRNLTESAMKFAKRPQRKVSRAAVNHAGIKHGAPPSENHHLLIFAKERANGLRLPRELGKAVQAGKKSGHTFEALAGC
jgi:hypothetical protein